MLTSMSFDGPPTLAATTSSASMASKEAGLVKIVIGSAALNEVLPLHPSIANMDQSSASQNRKNRRSNVLMSASLELSGTSLPVKLRNLSAEGALVEGESLPIEGASILFRKGDLSMAGVVAWVKGCQAGINFAQKLNPEQLLRHVPAPRPRVTPTFRRPGLSKFADSEQGYGDSWHWRFPGATD